MTGDEREEEGINGTRGKKCKYKGGSVGAGKSEKGCIKVKLQGVRFIV